tara:strand:- start:1807 stop:2055 length:249 start_codon:yes stop_codon:yes gene_type:complete
MTQFTDKVKKQKERLAAEEWGNKVKYIHASDGIIETAYNNGDKKIEENKPNGKVTWERSNLSKRNLLEEWHRTLADMRWFGD